MAIPRAGRSRDTDEMVPVNGGSDSDGDTEPEDGQPTPKARRTHSKKRLSDVHDTSFTMDSGRSRKSLGANDDAAEKRKRRQSARLVLPEPEAEAGPSSEANADERDSSRVSMLAKQKNQLATVERTPLAVPRDQQFANFEEWMKLNTDGKINANNAWDLALIDYFHDMSLLRNTTDNSINFQRASCTLDGCVKIWTSRVDSVGTDTGKLLNNLVNEGRAGDDDEDEGEDGEGEPGSQKRKKAHRPAATLAKDPSQLRNKKVELEFRVDPLYKKTSADFDEGGANGLLMNHLSLGMGADACMRVVFDASDSIIMNDAEPQEDEKPSEVDLSFLRKEFLPDLEAFESTVISSSLHDFAFAKPSFTFESTVAPIVIGDDDDEADDFPEVDADGDANMVDGAGGPIVEESTEDFFAADHAAGDDYSPDYPTPNSPTDGGDQGEGSGGGEYTTFDPDCGPGGSLTMTEAGPGKLMFDYFDETIRRNWAGPEHWKLRKLVKKPETEAAPKQRREKKEAFKIDFLAPMEKDVKEITRELFAPPAKLGTILLPGTGAGTTRANKRKRGKGKDKDDKEKRDNQTLPDDMHFSSRQLVSLFLKPKFSVHMRNARGRGELDDRQEIDEAYWAKAAADQAANRAGDEFDDTNGPIPFGTQFMHGEFGDTGGSDDGDDDHTAANDEEQDLVDISATQPRRARPETVNYAKRAKRVDVRKLKDNIWKNLDIVVPPTSEDDAMETDLNDERDPTDPSEARTFDKVITGLKQSYPKDKMAEISTSFCFICLLHLANERGLKLENDMAALRVEDEEDVGQKPVGDIWDLKIYRDPDAIPSA